VKADVAMSGIDTEILMASYVENNTSQGKCWIFDFGSTIHDVLIRIYLTLWLQRRKELSKW